MPLWSLDENERVPTIDSCMWTPGPQWGCSLEEVLELLGYRALLMEVISQLPSLAACRHASPASMYSPGTVRSHKLFLPKSRLAVVVYHSNSKQPAWVAFGRKRLRCTRSLGRSSHRGTRTSRRASDCVPGTKGWCRLEQASLRVGGPGDSRAQVSQVLTASDTWLSLCSRNLDPVTTM